MASDFEPLVYRPVTEGAEELDCFALNIIPTLNSSRGKACALAKISWRRRTNKSVMYSHSEQTLQSQEFLLLVCSEHFFNYKIC